MTARALISVSDKTGVVAFARALSERGVEILSTGGTLAALKAENVPVGSVEDYTGSPEVMDGRVKTLHPRVHGGILARLDKDRGDLDRLGAAPIDFVTVKSGQGAVVVSAGATRFTSSKTCRIGALSPTTDSPSPVRARSAFTSRRRRVRSSAPSSVASSRSNENGFSM